MKKLVDEAKQIAADLQHQIAGIKGELAEVEHEKLNLEDKLHHANLAHDRLANFQPEIGGKHKLIVRHHLLGAAAHNHNVPFPIPSLGKLPPQSSSSSPDQDQIPQTPPTPPPTS